MTKQELFALVDKVAETRNGQLDEIESAIGMLIVGRHFGWKVLYLIHSRKTIKKYEEILGIEDIRHVLPELGPQAHRSRAWAVAEKLSNFWKVVKGEVPGVKTTEVT